MDLSTVKPFGQKDPEPYLHFNPPTRTSGLSLQNNKYRAAVKGATSFQGYRSEECYFVPILSRALGSNDFRGHAVSKVDTEYVTK